MGLSAFETFSTPSLGFAMADFEVASVSTAGDLDHVALLPNMYSLLQLSARMVDMERADAGQVFELIEDPLLNLLVPVVIQIVMDIIKSPIIDLLCEIFASLLAQLLAEPLGTAIFPGLDTSSLADVAGKFQPTSAAAKKAISSSTTTTTTTTTTSGFLEVEAHLGLGAAGVTSDAASEGAALPPDVSTWVQQAVAQVAASIAISEDGGLVWDAPAVMRIEGREQLAALLEDRHMSWEGVRQLVVAAVAAHQRALERPSDGMDHSMLAPLAGVGGHGRVEQSSPQRTQPHQAFQSDASEDLLLPELEGSDEPFDEDTSDWVDDPGEEGGGGLLTLHPGLSPAERADALRRPHAYAEPLDLGHGGSVSAALTPDAALDASLLELHADVEVTDCSAALTPRECDGMQPPVIAGRCSWCVKGADATVGKCVACDPAKVAGLVKNGFTCSKDEDFCRAVAGYYAAYFHLPPPAPPKGQPGGSSTPADSESGGKKPKLPQDDDSSLPKVPARPEGSPPPNEAAAQFVRTATDVVTTQLTHMLHAGLVPILRMRMRDKLVRGTMRETVGPITSAVTANLHATLPPLLIDSLTAVTTRRLSAEMTQTLSSALIPAITESIARHPAIDHMCFLCHSYQVYCDACTNSRKQDSVNGAFSWDVAQSLAAQASRAVAGSGFLDVAVARSLAEEAASVVAGSKPKKGKK